jgi:hypothetical protein
MKIIALTALAAALALLACAKKQEPQSEAPPSSASAAPGETVAAPRPAEKADMPAGFPKMTASYTGVYEMRDDLTAEPRLATLEVAGWKRVRMEMPHFNAAKAAAGAKVAMVMDDSKRRMLMFASGPDAPQVAVVMPQEKEESIFHSLEQWGAEDGVPPSKVGSDKVAGIDCDIWESAPDGSGDAPEQACVTRDGVFLWSKTKGAEHANIIAKSIKRGPVDAGRFAVPAGFEVVEMGPCMRMGAEMAAAAQAGQQPDLAKMQECQALAAKVSALMGAE